MTVLRKFLCCCELSNGALIIAWAGLAFDVISLAVTSGVLGQPICLSIGVLEYKAPAAFILACTVISSLANVALLWAIREKNRLYLLPWLVLTMLFIVFIIVGLFVLGINQALIGANGAAVGIFISGFLLTGILLYLWICILSYFQEIRESLKNENRSMQRYA